MDMKNVVSPYNGLLLGLKREVLTRVTTWMHFEDIVLSERSQSQKTTYCVILFI